MVIDRLFGLLATSEMKCEQFGHLLEAVVIDLLEGTSDNAVMRTAVTIEEAAVGRLLRQRVAEDVDDPVADRRS